MKKYLLFGLMMALAVSFTACQAPDGGENGNENDKVELKACDQHDFELIAKYLGGSYFHDSFSDNAYNYNIVLSADGEREVLDAATGLFDLHEDLPLYALDLYSPVPAPEMNKKFNVPVGTYTFDAEDTCNPGTLSVAYTYRYLLDGETYEYEETWFTAGTVEVTKDVIEAVLVDDKGKTHHIRYAGTFVDNSDNFGVMKDVGPHTTLTGDLNLSFAENESIALNNGDYYVIGMNLWDVIFYEAATDSQFYLSVLAPLDVERLVGEFPLSSDWNKPQVVLPGFVSSYYTFWSWYDIYDGDAWIGGGPIVEGKMVISENANGTQHVVVDVKDDGGHSIKAEFDTDMYGEGGASPWSTRGNATLIKKPRVHKPAQHKVVFQPIKR